MKSKTYRDFENIYKDMVQAIKEIYSRVEATEKIYRDAEDRDDYDTMTECEVIESESYKQIALLYRVVMHQELDPIDILRILKIRGGKKK